MAAIVFDPLGINCAYYEAHAEDFCRKTAAVLLDDIYQPFLKLLPADAHILDAGCGSGRDSLAFMKRGFHVTAIDASPAMVRVARSSGVEARVLAFQDMNFLVEFDGLWACASLLHVPHSEMADVLNRFRRALHSQGVLYLSLKEGTGERVAEDGRFFSYFTFDEFSDQLAREGSFEIIEAWKRAHPDSSGTVRTWLNFLARKTS